MKEDENMQITKETAAYHSIIWFAVDSVGHIVMADSREGNIPSFASNNETITEALAQKLFCVKAVDRNRNIAKENVAEKGFYFFAVDDPYESSSYRLIAKPQKPLLIGDLDDETKQILLGQKIDINAEETDTFTI